MTTATLEPTSGFHALNLSQALLSSIAAAGYKNPSSIQKAFIPRVLAGTDVMGQAQTGTGKTASYLIPYFERWRDTDHQHPTALVIVPTRELAIQVCDEAKKLCPDKDLVTLPVYGGRPMDAQVRGLRNGVDLVVGTPGRLLDHIGRRTLQLSHVRYLVLDEADRMFDLGFRDDIRRILRNCPTDRQTLLLSATMPPDILSLAKRYMRKPIVHLQMSPRKVTIDKIRQSYFTVDKHNKFELLLRLIEREQPRQCIIFCERKIGAQRIYEKLCSERKRVAAMHGDLMQSQRERIMKAFKEGKIVFLVATDVVGRGIDVMDISHIINFDLPMDPENYVHRIGRTGRMGKDGVAISFVTIEEGDELTKIENFINKVIPEEKLPDFEAYTPRVKKKPDEPTDAKPVFGRRSKRYSSRL
ncbi:MAG TPA: DEAD/DEAH box helicase [Gemmataceae bacterium]|nr:DEAD/DEAH box helicase [Gemmataceae bacterium]